MRRLTSIPLLFALVILCMPLHAQTVDTAILGTVSDSTGAVIPGATVTVTSPATGIEKKAVTASGGEYNVTYLIPGSYDVSVSANGFAPYAHKGIVLQINQQAKINVVLQISGSQQVVEVQGAQPLLQSENATLGAVIGPERAANLPLNGRKFDDLAVLTPGVTVSDPDDHSSSTNGSTIAANGGQVTWGQVNVDGVSMTNNRHAYVNVYPSVDAIQEFSVLTSNYAAQYGGGAGAVVNIQLKTGTNSLHGDVFEFIRNNAVDARNLFRPAPLPKNVLKQNQFGATLGGPVYRDRTFFFVSYEGIRSIEQTTSTTNVLTAAQRNGDFSATKTALKNPYKGGTYKNNQIPVDPVAQSIINTYMPLPNTFVGGNNYSSVSTGSESVNQYIGRIDHKFNDSNQLAIHYIYAFRNFPLVSNNPNFTFTGTYPIHNAGLQYIHTFSPRIVNELRLGVDLEHVKQLSTRTNTGFTASSIGINGFLVGGPAGRALRPDEEGFPTLAISGYLGIGDGTAASNLDYSRTYQVTDNVTWTRGKHTIILGGDLRYALDDATTNNVPFGSESFTGSLTGDAAADYILGVPASVLTPEGVPITKARQWRVAGYVQDDWKVTPRLTVNIGLRYDLWVPPVDVNNVSHSINFNTSPPSLYPAAGQRLNNLWTVSHKDFSPRLGFADNITPTLVVRAAYGITFYGGQFDNINILQLNPPTAGSITITNGTNAGNPPLATIQNPVPAALYPANPFFNLTSLPVDRKHPDLYLQTYNLTVSKQFWSNVLDVSYVGVKGTHQDTSITHYNSPAPQILPPGVNLQQTRPYPTIGRIRLLDFEGASDYNALQVHFEHRLTHGLTFTAAYTLSHILDNQSGDTNSTRSESQNPHTKEWATGLSDQRHYLSVGFVWQLPTLSGGNFAERAVLNGWGFNGLMQFISGNPYNISQAQDGQNNDSGYERPDQVAGQPVTVPHRTVAEWFNTAAFAESVGHYGSTPRNSLVGPSIDPISLAIARSFAMPYERQQHLEFRLEVFNALNTPQLSSPGASQGSSTFGRISSTRLNNRELQLAVKYLF